MQNMNSYHRLKDKAHDNYKGHHGFEQRQTLNSWL